MEPISGYIPVTSGYTTTPSVPSEEPIIERSRYVGIYSDEEMNAAEEVCRYAGVTKKNVDKFLDRAIEVAKLHVATALAKMNAAQASMDAANQAVQDYYTLESQYQAALAKLTSDTYHYNDLATQLSTIDATTLANVKAQLPTSGVGQNYLSLVDPTNPHANPAVIPQATAAAETTLANQIPQLAEAYATLRANQTQLATVESELATAKQTLVDQIITWLNIGINNTASPPEWIIAINSYKNQFLSFVNEGVPITDAINQPYPEPQVPNPNDFNFLKAGALSIYNNSLYPSLLAQQASLQSTVNANQITYDTLLTTTTNSQANYDVLSHINSAIAPYDPSQATDAMYQAAVEGFSDSTPGATLITQVQNAQTFEELSTILANAQTSLTTYETALTTAQTTVANAYAAWQAAKNDPTKRQAAILAINSYLDALGPSGKALVDDLVVDVAKDLKDKFNAIVTTNSSMSIPDAIKAAYEDRKAFFLAMQQQYPGRDFQQVLALLPTIYTNVLQTYSSSTELGQSEAAYNAAIANLVVAKGNLQTFSFVFNNALIDAYNSGIDNRTPLQAQMDALSLTIVSDQTTVDALHAQWDALNLANLQSTAAEATEEYQEARRYYENKLRVLQLLQSIHDRLTLVPPPPPRPKKIYPGLRI